jgi:tetratricopeptide (TPR) repeat protein
VKDQASIGRDLAAHTTLLGDARERAPLSPEVESLGRYLLEERIGRGGMGEVFRARDPDLDRAVAIKRLMAVFDDDQAQLRLLREGQAIARLSHPNVVQVYDVGKDAATGDTFIAMELVDGVTLRQWLRGRPTWREIASLFRQAGEGLLAAHREGIVHRDFKPENVLVTAGPVAKVVDFGLARAATASAAPAVPAAGAMPRPRRRIDASHAASRSHGPSPAWSNDSSLTPVGARLGTPAYMAPEQQGGTTTPLADQFSFGVALFEALTGYLPFPGDGPAQYAVCVLEGALLEFPRGSPVPKRLQDAIYRTLEADPSLRFASLAPLLDELARDPAAIRRRRLGIGGAVATGAAVATLAWVMGIAPADPTSRCDREATARADFWDDARAEEITRAMRGIDLPFASDTAERATALLAANHAAWIDARRRWCVAAVREPEASSIHDARGRCLDAALGRHRELVASLQAPDAQSLVHALDAIELAARGLERCDDPAELAHHVAAAAGDETRRAATEVLAKARSRLEVGQYAAGLRALDELVLRDDPAIALEHLVIRSALEEQLGNLDQARALLEQAARVGLGADAPLLAAEWNGDYGDLLYAQGEIDAMAGPYDRAWMLLRGLRGDDHIDTLVALGTRGHVPLARGDYAAALTIFSDAATRAALVVGPDHRARIMLDEWVTLAMSHSGALDEARARLQDLVTRLTQTRGATHPRTLDLREALATVELRANHAEAALAHFEAVLAARPAPGPDGDPVDRASTLANIGAASMQLDDHEHAAVALTEALALLERAGLGPTHPSVRAVQSNLATVERRRGRTDLALAALRRIVAQDDATGAPLTSDAIATRINLAQTLLEAHRDAEAVDGLRALVERAAAGDDAVAIARASQALAEALDRTGDRAGADLAIATAAKALAGQPTDNHWRAELETYRRQRLSQ